MKTVALFCGLLVLAGVARSQDNKLDYPNRAGCNASSRAGCDSTPNPGTNTPSGGTPTPGSNVTNPTPSCDSKGASCTGLDTGTLLPYKGDCTKFVDCVGGCGVDMNCPDGLHFNSKLSVCDWPEDAGCDPSITRPPTSATPSTPGSGSSNGTQTPPGGTPTPGSNVTNPTPSCDSKGASCTGLDTGTLLPYKGDCTKFVDCVGGCGVDMNCPDGLHFNSKLSVCDWPEDAGCDPSITRPPTSATPSTPGSGSSNGTQTPPGGTPTPGSNVTNPTPSCDSKGASCTGLDTGTLLPYKGDCTKFVDCVGGCGVDMNCPDGLHFNSKLSVCDWPEDAGCDPSITRPPTSATPSTPGTGSSNGTQTPPGGTPTPGSNVTNPTPSCDSKGASCTGLDTGTLLPYKGDCTKFVDCVGGCGVDMNCPDGLHFNSKLSVCDWPEDAGCDPSITRPPTAATPSTPGTGSSNGTNTPPGGTPGSNVTNPTPSCDSKGASCTGLDTGTLLPYKGDCTKFVDCVGGCGVDMNCPDNLHFNSKLSVCDWPEDAGCDPSVTKVPGGNSTSPPNSSPATLPTPPCGSNGIRC